jgi:hypothetical protein
VMLYQEMNTLADQLAGGELDTAQAVKRLRELATHTPSEQCQRMVSCSRWLARIEETWTWGVVVDQDMEYGGPKLISNRFTHHQSNLGTVIDFRWWEPADIDALGRALCAAAESEAFRRAGEEDSDE